MNIDVEKLNKSVNRYRDNAKAAFNPIEDDADYYKGKIDACEDIQEVIASLQQEQLDQEESVWVHKKYNREYRIVSNNARLKNSNGEWINCVIYAPLYENEFEMFAREKESFYREFEKK